MGRAQAYLTLTPQSMALDCHAGLDPASMAAMNCGSSPQ
jgi:hypothetical protein